MARRTCDDLGLCQARTPRCTGCSAGDCIPEARADFPSDCQISTWMKWALVWAAGTSAVAAVMFAAGYLS